MIGEELFNQVRRQLTALQTSVMSLAVEARSQDEEDLVREMGITLGRFEDLFDELKDTDAHID